MIGPILFTGIGLLAAAWIFVYFGHYWWLHITRKDDDD